MPARRALEALASAKQRPLPGELEPGGSPSVGSGEINPGPVLPMNPGANVTFSNLRAVVILIVVAFHSALPYLASQPPHPFAFDAPPYRWIAFPIIDRERWFGLDLFCAWQDVSLMSLMFLLAGLFTRTDSSARVAPPISRSGGGELDCPSSWRSRFSVRWRTTPHI
ncbi:hypothetical protein [Bradyrhizobium sp. BR 1432]|uniref:hypothetical protein n=1 Tax=Bradyrhizobium sp. BR 1432 TaxID=3447966 RepID=UPI003EE6F539